LLNQFDTLTGITWVQNLVFYITCGMLFQVENLQQGNARYRNTWEGLTTIVCNQGWRQLFAGLSINYIKVIIHNY
jgi:hypothetical protein